MPRHFRSAASGAIERERHPVPEELLTFVVAYFRPRRIILFGSRARGEAGADSDFDLLVILDDDAPPERLSWRAGYEARKDLSSRHRYRAVSRIRVP